HGDRRRRPEVRLRLRRLDLRDGHPQGLDQASIEVKMDARQAVADFVEPPRTPSRLARAARAGGARPPRWRRAAPTGRRLPTSRAARGAAACPRPRSWALVSFSTQFLGVFERRGPRIGRSKPPPNPAESDRPPAFPQACREVSRLRPALFACPQ